jgi:hypothetical protein
MTAYVETTLKLSETEFSDLTIEQMQIKQQSDEVIQILVRHLQNDTATFMDFVGVTGGYKCKSGVVELQEQIYRGGADGTYVNAKFKTKITLLETDDLVVYQQVATPKMNKHLYYVFKKVQ